MFWKEIWSSPHTHTLAHKRSIDFITVNSAKQNVDGQKNKRKKNCLWTYLFGNFFTFTVRGFLFLCRLLFILFAKWKRAEWPSLLFLFLLFFIAVGRFIIFGIGWCIFAFVQRFVICSVFNNFWTITSCFFCIFIRWNVFFFCCNILFVFSVIARFFDFLVLKEWKKNYRVSLVN